MATTLEAPVQTPDTWRDEEAEQIDTRVDIVTPENIAFNYRVAGPFRRMPAFFIDFGLRLIFMLFLAGGFWTIFFGVSYVAGAPVLFLGALLTAIYLVLMFVQQWFYGGLFETFWNGQTPGKWVLGIRVLTVEGQPINMMQAVMRNILRVVDFTPPLIWNIFQPLATLEPFASAPGDHTMPATPVMLVVIPVMLFTTSLIVMAMNNKYQRLGDLLCGTMVVIEERSWLMGVARLEDPRAAQLATYLPPNYVVSRSLAKTLATYVERRQYFSLNRRREIAKYLAEPLLVRFGLPHDTSHDLLLCALYYRTFVADRGSEEGPAGPSPFRPPDQPGSPPLELGRIQIRV